MSSQRYLQTLLDFTDTDLNANRRGHLSKAQVDMLQGRATQELKLLLVIPALVATWIFLSVDLKLSLPAIFIIGCLVAGAISLHRDHLKTYKTKPIRSLSGTLSKKPIPGQLNRSQFMIHLGGEHLAVERHLFERLPEGKFTLYLYGDQILSMEPSRSSGNPVAKTAPARPAAKSVKKSASTRPATAKKAPSKAVKTASRKPVAKKRAARSAPSKVVAAPKMKLAKATGNSKNKVLPLTRTRDSVSTSNQKARSS